MEKAKERWEMNALMNELKQGKELTKQLKNHLNPSLSTPQTRQYLIKKILSSYEKALCMLKRDHSSISTESPLSPLCSLANSSPKSEVCDKDCNRDISKKRKTMPRWSEQVRVCSGTGLEGPGDDGYCWRKYGQKDILGANHPRGYYRCTHRHVQGCLATKQVQRSDQDPTIFEITYRGRHTCAPTQSSHLTPPKLSEEKEWPMQNQEPIQKQGNDKQPQVFQNFAGLKVKTEDLDSENIAPLFSFLSSADAENLDGYNIFSNPIHEDNFMGNFISPATSDSNYFSPCRVANFWMCQNSDPDHAEIISAPTSVTNSPIGELDLAIGSMDFDTSSLFNVADFFLDV